MPHTESESRVLALHDEELVVTRRRVARRIVRVATRTQSHDRLVEEVLAHERVEIERVPVGIFVDVAPPVRQEGDVTILPVMEEVVIVERRLRLREEIHVRLTLRTEQHVETVVVRSQDAVITRTPVAAAADLMITEPTQ